jgi:hypothetical protein
MQRPRDGGYTTAVSGQRLDKHVPVARRQILNNATVGLQQWKNCVLYVVCDEVIGETRFEAWSVESEFCTGICDEKT